MKSVEYLKKVKKLKGLSSNKLGELLNMNHTSMSKLLTEKTTMSDYTASQVAEILGIDEMEIIALCNMERARKEEEKDYWFKKLQKLAACVIATATLAIGTLSHDIRSGDGAISAEKTALYAISAITALFLLLSHFA
ncbi:MAG: hypothetical protein HWD86_04770 [Kangiellaceae bacterium]|nr:hypothetical protein [Kangiellaceae bacterium]